MTKDKRFNWRFYLCCGLFIWFIINLLQGVFTEIQEDEAYYALYGEHLAWGYFDHPPMVGLMTFLSSLLFSGTLGVRWMTVLTSCLSLWVIWKIAEVPKPAGVEHGRSVVGPTPEKVVLFFIFACSVVMFNIYGFVTTPDVSLILFSALFLLVYQQYLAEKSWLKVLLMGLLMACMAYSKYHAFLLLGLIVLSNLALLKDGKFYVACFLALALLTPHILWQVNMDFPSFKYHLMQRSEPFRWSYFLEYLPNQLLVFNPFTFGAIVYVLLKYRARDTFERGLHFILVGFFFFFWLTAFRGHVEPHWTFVGVIPATVLVYRRSHEDEKLKRYAKRVIFPSLLTVLAFRVLLATPVADRFGYHGKEAYYRAIEQAAGDCPVVFCGSFQKPSLYHYFTGKGSSTLQCYYDRMTQYDLWQFDKAWAGKPVFVFGHINERSKQYRVGNMELEGFLCDDFSSANRLVTTFEITNMSSDNTPVFHHGDTIRVDFAIYNPCEVSIDFQHKDFAKNIKAHYLPGDVISHCYYKKIGEIEPKSTYKGQLYTIVNDEAGTGKHLFNLGIGDRISSFVTEESGVTIMIEP